VKHTVLVTGGSAGIGEAICRCLLDDGGMVINLDINPPGWEHERLHFYCVDLTDAQATLAAVKEVMQNFTVGGLVNNAGAVRPGLIEEATLEDFDHVVSLNLRAALILAQAVVPGMRKARYGRIVNIASRAALGKALRSVYSATKAGLIGFTRTWALELAGDGITVNAVAPGPIATELFLNANPADSPQTRKIIEGVPVKRLGTSEDVARAVLFFLTPEAGFITGQVLNVCGGLSIGAAPI
jgi:3-oxoacyl-[acyl-carrier protein] reductase